MPIVLWRLGCHLPGFAASNWDEDFNWMSPFAKSDLLNHNWVKLRIRKKYLDCKEATLQGVIEINWMPLLQLPLICYWALIPAIEAKVLRRHSFKALIGSLHSDYAV